MIRNKCSYRIWPAISSCGRTTGFVLQPGESNTVAVPSTWFGILWGRTLCSEEATGKFSCITGDWASRGKVAPPVTVVELVLNGTGGNDLYAVSLVKGFSLPVTVESQDLSCTRTGCVKELNVACPKELKGRTLCSEDVTGKLSCVTGDCGSSTVKTLLQKVEEEAVVSKFSKEVPSFLKLVNSPMSLLAPTPASTPQIANLSDSNETALPSAVDEEQLIQRAVNEISEGKNNEKVESEKSVITRSLLLDFSDKSEVSECSSEVTYQEVSQRSGGGTLMIRNKCSYRIWPAISSCGRTTGFVLQPGESNTVAVPSTWFGILWGRTLCSEEATGKFSCITGDWASRGKVAPPVTVVELVLNGTGGNDLYAVSLVKGFSLPVTVESQDLSCTRTGCVKELNVACPKELKVIRDGEGVACRTPAQPSHA
uniref:Thaumatin-like protein 1 n=1 Tax=Cajanus cajan TaxID=3821 RepID=A0A151QP44_CAJCA|nr:Thaumatin-like protein 1 [Cajanus cajan]